MEKILIDTAPFLISAVLGAGFTVATMLGWFKVLPKEKWQDFQMEMNAQRRHGDKVTAENAKLRVALATGVLTEEGKKVAAMTTAALDALIGTEEVG